MAEAETASAESPMLPMLMDITKKMEQMQEEMRTMRSERATEQAEQADTTAASPERGLEEDSEDSDSEAASPETLRRDRRLMRQAAKRINRLRFDQDDDENIESDTPRSTGKKSGSVMTATDKVRKAVDWPHMYVHRMAAGTRKGVTFAELRVEEFVFGFLKMLVAPKNKFDMPHMVEMLTYIMQDTMEFSWQSARRFYEQVGRNIEMGMLEWTDEPAIERLRMQYARTVFPAVKETKDYNKTPLVQAPPNTKCCVPYQQRSCEQERDHHPFVHACAYCHRTKTVICRHPESDCYRKMNDNSKNGKQREPNSSLAQ